MPALAIIVMSFSTMPFSFSQNAKVPATSRNGKPEEKPSRHIVLAAGCENARHTDGLRTPGALGSVGIVNRVRRMVGEALLTIDRAATQSIAQRWCRDLIIDT